MGRKDQATATDGRSFSEPGPLLLTRGDRSSNVADYLSQWVDYPVPAERINEVLEFDHSTLLNRTAGQIGAVCVAEAYNTLTLNLVVEIIEGRRTAQEARDFYGPAATDYAKGESSPYAEALTFTPQAGSADPDEAIISLEEIKKSLR